MGKPTAIIRTIDLDENPSLVVIADRYSTAGRYFSRHPECFDFLSLCGSINITEERDEIKAESLPEYRSEVYITGLSKEAVEVVFREVKEAAAGDTSVKRGSELESLLSQPGKEHLLHVVHPSELELREGLYVPAEEDDSYFGIKAAEGFIEGLREGEIPSEIVLEFLHSYGDTDSSIAAGTLTAQIHAAAQSFEGMKLGDLVTNKFQYGMLCYIGAIARETSMRELRAERGSLNPAP